MRSSMPQRLSRERRKPVQASDRRSVLPPLGHLSEVEIPRDVGDFRLVDRKALDCFLAMPERDRFVRGMFAWIGFRQAVVSSTGRRARRARRKYSLRQDDSAGGRRARVVLRRAAARWRFGRASAFRAARSSTRSRVDRLWATSADFARGWSSIIVLIAFLGGANMLMTGILGALCRAHPRRGEAPPALFRRPRGRF